MASFFTYRLAGLTRLQKAVQAVPGVLAAENAVALRSSVDLVEATAVANTPTGPGHFGYHLRDRFFTRVQVGVRRSTGIVGTDAPQGRWREVGTKAHDIAPRGGRVLILDASSDGAPIGRQFAASVHHPGVKPRHTLRKALNASKPAIRGFFVGATLRATESMAGSGD